MEVGSLRVLPQYTGLWKRALGLNVKVQASVLWGTCDLCSMKWNEVPTLGLEARRDKVCNTGPGSFLPSRLAPGREASRWPSGPQARSQQGFTQSWPTHPGTLPGLSACMGQQWVAQHHLLSHLTGQPWFSCSQREGKLFCVRQNEAWVNLFVNECCLRCLSERLTSGTERK